MPILRRWGQTPDTVFTVLPVWGAHILRALFFIRVPMSRVDACARLAQKTRIKVRGQVHENRNDWDGVCRSRIGCVFL